MIFPRTSLHFQLVPVQYREYEYGLLHGITGRLLDENKLGDKTRLRLGLVLVIQNKDDTLIQTAEITKMK